MVHKSKLESANIISRCQVLDLSRQRHECIQTETPQLVPSNSQEGNTEKQMSFQLGYIAYQFLFLEVSTRSLCVQSEIDSTSKVCSSTRIHPECNPDIL